MEEKVVSKRQLNRKYKGKAPCGIDRFIGFWGKIILQVLIFTILYTACIGNIRFKYNNFFIEFSFVFLWLIISDFLALLGSVLIKVGFNYKMDYLPSDKKKNKNYNRRGYEYLFYTGFRCLSYIIGLTPFLISLVLPFMPFLWGFFAYLTVWLFICITTKLLAKGISIAITKSV